MFKKVCVFLSIIFLFGVCIIPIIAGTGDCIISNASSRVNINIHSGAGRDYLVVGSFKPNESRIADQVAQDLKGRNWFRLTFGEWVMSLPARASLECAFLP